MAPNSYERCQAILGRLFGRIVVDYMRWRSWAVAGFSDRTPYPTGKRSDGGAVGKVCRGCDEGIFGTFLLRGIGLTVLLQLPNSYPCILGGGHFLRLLGEDLADDSFGDLLDLRDRVLRCFAARKHFVHTLKKGG
jgi:hypothetical protein